MFERIVPYNRERNLGAFFFFFYFFSPHLCLAQEPTQTQGAVLRREALDFAENFSPFSVLSIKQTITAPNSNLANLANFKS